MALYFLLRGSADDKDDEKELVFPWYVGESVPFIPISMLEGIQADGHEKEHLEKIHVLHSLFGGASEMRKNVIITVNPEAALVVYGMMLREQAIEKFGR